MIAIIAILASLLLPALGKAKERARRTACLSNLGNILKSCTMYAMDNEEQFFSARGRAVQIALDPPEEKAAAQVALQGKIWTCPNRPQFPIYEPDFAQLIIGYQYFGGITNWLNRSGSFPSRSPVKLATAQPFWVLAADTTMKIDGVWGGGRPTAYAGMPSHKGSARWPAGGNQVHMDGSARWIRFDEMYFIHSWSADGTRDAYFFQEDLGNFKPAARDKAKP